MNVEALQHKLAELKVKYDDDVRDLISGLSDDEIKELIRQIEPRSNDYAGGYVRDAIQIWRGELGCRYAFRRSIELGCAVYCVVHDCDIKNCPSGEHD